MSIEPWYTGGWLEARLQQHTTWTRPVTFVYMVVLLVLGTSHFVTRNLRQPWRWRKTSLLDAVELRIAASTVHRASATSSARVPEVALLVVRTTTFAWNVLLLAQSSFADGVACLKFFTFWNFIALTVFFGLGAALSCSCCRQIARLQPPSREHRIAAALHLVLLEMELPLSVVIAAIVWLVIYPFDLSNGNPVRIAGDLNLTSLTMHAANVAMMFLEFCLNGLLLNPEHVGLVIAWAMLYGVFNGLQAVWTQDPVYFFMDLTQEKTPLVALALTALLCASFYVACAFSALKKRLMHNPPGAAWGEACRAAAPLAEEDAARGVDALCRAAGGAGGSLRAPLLVAARRADGGAHALHVDALASPSDRPSVRAEAPGGVSSPWRSPVGVITDIAGSKRYI